MKKIFTLSVLVSVVVLAGSASAYVIGENGEIVGVSASASSQMGSGLAAHIVDGSGMDIFGNDTHHITWPDFMWLSNNTSPVNEWVEFNLGGVYNLTTVNIWNFNERNPTWGTIAQGNTAHGRGVYNMDILVAGTDHVFTAFSNVNLNEAGDGSPVFDTVALAANGVKYVKFDINSNLASLYPNISQDYVGLSEVMFYGQTVPEPVTMMFLGLGGIALIRRGRSA